MFVFGLCIELAQLKLNLIINVQIISFFSFIVSTLNSDFTKIYFSVINLGFSVINFGSSVISLIFYDIE